MKKKQSKPSKMKRLAEELRKEHEKSSEYLTRLKYLQADFENYRKRIDKEIHGIAQTSKEELIFKFLTIIDELELALQSGKKNENKEALLQGVSIILEKLKKALEDEGLNTIRAVGTPFDPKKHEAVLEVKTDDYPEETVIEEIRKGYMLRNKVIRPSIVKVARTRGAKGE